DAHDAGAVRPRIEPGAGPIESERADRARQETRVERSPGGSAVRCPQDTLEPRRCVDRVLDARLDGDCGGVDEMRAGLEESPVFAAVDAHGQMWWTKPARGVADRGVEHLRVGWIDGEYSHNRTDGKEVPFPRGAPIGASEEPTVHVGVQRPRSKWVDGDRRDPCGAACRLAPR